MTFAEIMAELKNFEGSEDFNNYVSGLLDADRVNAYLTTDDGKRLLQPMLDKYHNKSLETWKNGSEFKSLLDAKIKELYPEADPKDTELAQLKAEIERMKTEAIRKDLTSQALKFANEKGLPADLVDFFIGADDKATKKNLELFEKHFSAGITDGVNKRLKDANYVPPNGDAGAIDGVTAAFMRRNPDIDFSGN